MIKFWFAVLKDAYIEDFACIEHALSLRKIEDMLGIGFNFAVHLYMPVPLWVFGWREDTPKNATFRILVIPPSVDYFTGPCVSTKLKK